MQSSAQGTFSLCWECCLVLKQIVWLELEEEFVVCSKCLLRNTTLIEIFRLSCFRKNLHWHEIVKFTKLAVFNWWKRK